MRLQPCRHTKISLVRGAASLAVYILVFAAIASATDPTLPSFLFRRDYYGASPSNWVQAGDTNGDGVPDLINNEVGYIQVLFGNGDGTFGPAGASTFTLSGADSFVATDLNGDGKVDLVLVGVNDLGASGMTVCMGNGDGTFQSGTFYQVPDSAPGKLWYFALGDFNGDGIPDVIAAGASGIWLFTGKRGGSFNAGRLATSLPTGAGAIATADFNGDNKLDVVVTMPLSNGGFAVLLGNGDGTFQIPKAFAQPSHPDGLAIGKLTKGGHPDIVLSGGSDFYIYSGNGAGGFSGPRYISLPVMSNIAVGDVNGDGLPDLVSASGYIAYGTASGVFKSPVHYPVANLQNNFYNVLLADLRNNGLTDIITDDAFGISVLLSRGKGKFEDGEWLPITGGAGCGATADFNRDGKPDLAVNTPAGISIMLGTGRANSPFVPGSTLTLANAACPVVGDLNGDGIPDLLVAANNPNGLYAYLGNGDGTFTLKGSIATPNSGGYVVLGDFNHDGKLDFATSGNLMAWGNGDGTFQSPQVIVSSPPTTGFSGIVAGDVNNDGWIDLVLTNTGTNPYYGFNVLLNNHNGGFTQIQTNLGEFSAQPILADLNGDRNLDLVLASPNESVASIYLGDGTGSFTKGPALLGPFGSFGGFNLVADVNGDGIPDVLVLGFDTIAVYVGQGGAAYESSFDTGTGSAPGSILAEALHGQSSSAGLPDIVVPDSSGGIMLLLNATK